MSHVCFPLLTATKMFVFSASEYRSGSAGGCFGFAKKQVYITGGTLTI
jgi:hypothetical protein